MKYDFDRIIDRTKNNSEKWNYIRNREDFYKVEMTDVYSKNGVIPMWVADMDFICPAPVMGALKAAVEHGIYGYTEISESYYEAVTEWMKKRHNWNVKEEWICVTPGVIPALKLIVRTFTEPGDSVIIQTPVYYPFFGVVVANGRKIIRNPLKFSDDTYSFDFIGLERILSENRVKMLILCSPHNPVGRVWRREELKKLGEICLKYNVLVVSDEIHSDLIYSGNKFTPFALINEQFANNSITCTAASKTFNIAGLYTSNIIIPNEKLRKTYSHNQSLSGLDAIGMFGPIAVESAYREGEEWLTQVMEYIEGNYNLLESFIKKNLPKIKLTKPQSTYLVWADFRELGLEPLELKNIIINKAKLVFDDGYIFGDEGRGFERINIACSRKILTTALEKLSEAIMSV